jgi:hypothetical protein
MHRYLASGLLPILVTDIGKLGMPVLGIGVEKSLRRDPM